MKLTLRSLAHRALWELDGRSGFKALRTPQGGVPIPASVPDHAAWWRELSPEHRLRSLLRDSSGPVVEPMEVDWHLEPFTGGQWPARTHWTQAMRARTGDLRTTWEVNRFGHVWTWLDAGLDGAAELERQVLSWRAANPFRAGVNWSSGQELALRSLAWLAGAGAWGARFSESGWQSLVELLYWHGVQIESELGFAVHTVRNNHILAEGLGLAAIGDAFGGFTESERWRRLGLEMLEEAVVEQFFADGGYCQHSHAYHAFALGLLFEADDWFAEVRPFVAPVYERALDYFCALVEPGGRLPNFGPNDRMQPVDYAALVTELARRAGREPLARRSASFPDAGLHVLRAPGVAATLRCGPLALRAGHDDALHVEVWLDDEPVTADAGSFRYRSVEHDYFTGAHSHNVVLVNRRGPRRLATRFTWTDGPNPVLEELDTRRRLATATYDGHPGVRWERRVCVDDEGVTVRDLLNPTGAGSGMFSLYWLLDAHPDDVAIEEDGSFTWNISTPRARITVSAQPLIGALEGTRAEVWPAPISRVYGTREAACRIELETHGRAVRFETRFARAEYRRAGSRQ